MTKDCTDGDCVGCLEINPVEYGYISSPVLNTKGADVVYLRSREKKPGLEKNKFWTQPLRLYGGRRLTRYQDFRIFEFKHLNVFKPCFRF